MAIGCIRFFDVTKGYGFIIPDIGGNDVFVDKAAMRRAGILEFEKGQRLTYEVEEDAKGAVKAVNLEGVAFVSREPLHSINNSHCYRPATFPQPGGRKSSAPTNEWQRNYDRYVDLARNSIEERVAREGYLQHAEHYYRMMTGSAS
jgi:CspA family cold shock protein